MSDDLALPDPRTEPTISAARAAKLLHLSEYATYEALRRGEIPVIKVGRVYRIPTGAFLAKVLQVPDGKPAPEPEPSRAVNVDMLLKPFGFLMIEAIKAGWLDDVLPLIMGATKTRQQEIR